MKVIAFYLPQFHETSENDEWWGKGFTEWVNVKKAQPLFTGHYQPRVPEDNNYYCLLDPAVMSWQADMARKNGVYGFCFYHYWFDGHMLLQKPMEIFLSHPEIDIHYCISWANESWTNAWVSSNSKTLIAQKYGDERNWKEHFDYLLPFFCDPRYIKINGKPLFILYRPEIVDCLNPMLDYWQILAKKAGLPGLSFAYQYPTFALQAHKDDSRFDYQIQYEPAYERELIKKKSLFHRIKSNMNSISDKYLHKSFDLSSLRKGTGPLKFNYDNTWNEILDIGPENEKSIPGAFVDWDNTPRRGAAGSVEVGASPEKFKKYFKQQVLNTRNKYHKDMIFIFAWNEWAEGGYLEPDEKYKDGYLRSIKEVLYETNEME